MNQPARIQMITVVTVSTRVSVENPDALVGSTSDKKISDPDLVILNGRIYRCGCSIVPNPNLKALFTM